MAEKVAAKDAQVGTIYLTRGGKQLDSAKKECLWGFYPVKVLGKTTGEDGTIKNVVVGTPWGTEIQLKLDYPLEISDLKELPAEISSPLANTTKISQDEEAPVEYVQKLKEALKVGEVEGAEKESRNKTSKFEHQQIVEELKKGTSVKEMTKIVKMEYRAIYSIIQQLKKKYRIQKVEKGTFKIVEK
jgi:hypothetical protein